MKRFSLLAAMIVLAAAQFGCGYRRACCNCQPSCAPASCDTCCTAGCDSGCCASGGYDHVAPQPAPANVDEDPQPTPAAPVVPQEAHVPVFQFVPEPTPTLADPSEEYDVARRPKALELNQPAPPPDVY